MPGTLNPNATAEDFATRVLGRQPTVEEIARGSAIKVNGQACSGCWIASPDGGNTYITYRPAGVASDTLPTTSTVEVNYKAAENATNAGKPVKLKFPLVDH
jgi:filamentous hemagglutinin